MFSLTIVSLTSLSYLYVPLWEAFIFPLSRPTPCVNPFAEKPMLSSSHIVVDSIIMISIRVTRTQIFLSRSTYYNRQDKYLRDVEIIVIITSRADKIL